MRKNLLISLLVLACESQGQTTLPPLENFNSIDKLPKNSYYNTYISSFDFIISFSAFSNWGSGMTTALAYNKIGWHKIEINTSRFPRDTTKSEILITTIPRSNDDSLFQVISENHLFNMNDERAKKITCDSFVIFDGPEYEFEIFAKGLYKKIYFYAPEDYYKACPDIIERKWIINCIRAFERYLGK
jgi:hypothetical protein